MNRKFGRTKAKTEKLIRNVLASESNFKQLLDSTIKIPTTEENEFRDNSLYFYCFYFDVKNKTIMPLPKYKRTIKNKFLKSVNIN